MARQTITINAPNDLWMKHQLEKKYSSKSGSINDLIRKERLWPRNELIRGEESGISNKTMTEILQTAKERAKKG